MERTSELDDLVDTGCDGKERLLRKYDETCLVSDRLLSKVTPRFFADDEGGERACLFILKTFENETKQ